MMFYMAMRYEELHDRELTQLLQTSKELIHGRLATLLK